MKILTVCLLIVYSVFAQAATTGKETYQMACKNCHAPNLAEAIKAPAAFDTKAWDKIMVNAKEEAKQNPQKYPNAMAYLIAQVKIGKGLMHHGGLCNEADTPNKDCSDETFIEAIKYMASEQKEQ